MKYHVDFVGKGEFWFENRTAVGVEVVLCDTTNTPCDPNYDKISWVLEDGIFLIVYDTQGLRRLTFEFCYDDL